MLKIKQLKNFGVVSEIKDDIILKELTIFMGDNSAGKSFVAMLINGFISMSRGYENKDFLKAIKGKFIDNNFLIELEESVTSILQDTKEQSISIIFNKENKKDIDQILTFSINEYLIKKYLLKKIFNNSISIDTIEIELNKIVNHIPKEIIITISHENESLHIEFIINEEVKIHRFQGEHNIDFIKNKIIDSIISKIIESTVKACLPNSSTYLPASRTGYLQTYKILAENAITNNLSSTTDNKLSILTSWFVNKLNQGASFEENSLALYIEKYILHGKINLFQDNNNIEFQLENGNKVNINYLSSTVSELIPLVVFLKRGFIKRDGLVIIEEPEAHLSFKNQKLMANLIALLIKNKIKVLITTHSDFLVYQLNNLIMQNSIKKIDMQDLIAKINNSTIEEEKANLLANISEIYNKDAISLNHKEIAIYNFILDNDSESSIINAVELDKYGINNQYIFNNISSISNERNKLLDLLDLVDANH